MSNCDSNLELMLMREQRSYAVATLVLVLALAGAVLSSNWGSEPSVNQLAREQVRLHSELDKQVLDVLHQNQAYLEQMRGELLKAKQAAAAR